MPKITKNIIIINVLCWLGSLVAARHGVDLTRWLGLHFFMASDFHFYQLFTYMFMHGGFEHLFFNMFAVFMFGRTLECVWGEKRFLTYYILCGIGAGLTQEFVQVIQYYTTLQGYTGVNLGSYVVSIGEYLNMMTTVGASGAVYGILLAFGMLYPNQQIYIYFVLPLKAKWFVVGYAVLELLLGLSQRGDGVAHFAHLGGMLFGLLLILYWRKRDRERFDTPFGNRLSMIEKIKRWYIESKNRRKLKKEKKRLYHFQMGKRTTYNRGEEFDRIMEKIKRSGYTSLTDEEKRKFFNETKQ